MILKNLMTVLVSAVFLTSGFSMAQEEVTDEDLGKFANIYSEVQVKNQALQQGMAEMIQEKGMDINRFNELYEAAASPEVEVEATPEELELHQEVVEEIENKQEEFQAEITELIQEEGMTLERYQEVFAQLQSDQELQQKFSEMMQSN